MRSVSIGFFRPGVGYILVVGLGQAFELAAGRAAKMVVDECKVILRQEVHR